MKKDTQIIELLGQNLLINQFLLAQLEVAKPVRDRGIDLIVYVDQLQFEATPIQMKCYSKTGFSVHKKYAQFPRLLMVYIWHVEDHPIIYAMRYEQAVGILEEMGATKNQTWLEKDHYTYNAPSIKLKTLMAPYLVEDWSDVFDFTTLDSSSV